MTALARNALALALLAASAPAHAAPEFSGQARLQATGQQPNTQGPLGLANTLAPGLVAAPADSFALDTELHARGQAWSAIATLEQERPSDDAWHSRAWFNELYVDPALQDWQLSAGRRIVAWDVGYGFRPNDVVQQEARRTLLPVTATGRPLAMLERYDATLAWSLVWVNPAQSRARRGADEPALAGRMFWHEGALDLHGFAREGLRTGASLGAAGSWVATDALELHGSIRVMRRADALGIAANASGLVPLDPWGPVTLGRTTQALIGGTWTNAQQFGLLAEAWWDGTAPAAAQWQAWNARDRQLAAALGTPAPRPAVAGNLAWQGQALQAYPNLQRLSLYGRASWTSDHWQPALDLLYQPADGGRILTATLGWQGDRWRWDAVWRWYGGPAASVLAQLPTRRIATLAATWTF